MSLASEQLRRQQPRQSGAAELADHLNGLIERGRLNVPKDTVLHRAEPYDPVRHGPLTGGGRMYIGSDPRGLDYQIAGHQDICHGVRLPYTEALLRPRRGPLTQRGLDGWDLSPEEASLERARFLRVVLGARAPKIRFQASHPVHQNCLELLRSLTELTPLMLNGETSAIFREAKDGSRTARRIVSGLRSRHGKAESPAQMKFSELSRKMEDAARKKAEHSDWIIGLAAAVGQLSAAEWQRLKPLRHDTYWQAQNGSLYQNLKQQLSMSEGVSVEGYLDLLLLARDHPQWTLEALKSEFRRGRRDKNAQRWSWKSLLQKLGKRVSVPAEQRLMRRAQRILERHELIEPGRSEPMIMHSGGFVPDSLAELAVSCALRGAFDASDFPELMQIRVLHLYRTLPGGVRDERDSEIKSFRSDALVGTLHFTRSRQ